MPTFAVLGDGAVFVVRRTVPYLKYFLETGVQVAISVLCPADITVTFLMRNLVRGLNSQYTGVRILKCSCETIAHFPFQIGVLQRSVS